MKTDEMAARIEALEARLTQVVDALVVLVESIQEGTYDMVASEVIEMLQDDRVPSRKR